MVNWKIKMKLNTGIFCLLKTPQDWVKKLCKPVNPRKKKKKQPRKSISASSQSRRNIWELGWEGHKELRNWSKTKQQQLHALKWNIKYKREKAAEEFQALEIQGTSRSKRESRNRWGRIKSQQWWPECGTTSSCWITQIPGGIQAHSRGFFKRLPGCHRECQQAGGTSGFSRVSWGAGMGSAGLLWGR